MTRSRVEVRTEGLKAMAESAADEALRDSVPLVDEVGRKIEDRIRRKLDRPGPSPPGQPPGREEGHLLRSIGRERAKKFRLTVVTIVGVGAGPEGRRGVERAKAAGVNVYEYADLHEKGGTRQGHRIPPRPFVRTTIAEVEGEVTRMLERGQ